MLSMKRDDFSMALCGPLTLAQEQTEECRSFERLRQKTEELLRERERLSRSREILEERMLSGKKATVEVLRPEDAQGCIDFQEALPTESKKTVLMRDLATYQKAAGGNNSFVCVRNSEGQIVATSACVEVQYGDHIVFDENSPFIEFANGDKRFMELSISIVSPEYRGHSLQLIMYRHLCERAKKLHGAERVLFTAACVLGNLASCKNIMSAGLEVVGLNRVQIGQDVKDIVIFARYPDQEVSTQEEILQDGDSKLENKSFLESILQKGKSVASRLESGARVYTVVSR